MLSKRCHEAFWNLDNPVFMRVFSVFDIIPTLLQGIYQPYFSAISRIFHISIIREYSLKKESIIFIGTILVRC